LGRQGEDALWQQVFTAQPARRRVFEPSSKRRKKAPAPWPPRYGLNAKTAAKWCQRCSTADRPMGPSKPKSTVLTEIEEAIVVEFRRRTLLPLDDVLGCLRQTIPTLSRSALHRCLQRHGYVHIDSCELRCAEGKVHMFLAIDRVSKFTYVELHPAATMLAGAAFLHSVIAAFPYKLHTILTDNGTPFADQPRYRSGPTARYRLHAFDRICPTTPSPTNSPSPITRGPTARPSG
jgi:hypothetical protein